MTSSSEPEVSCTSASGRCAFIDSITADGDGFVVTYSTVGFEPAIDDEGAQHIHFFFDTVPLEAAGLPAAGPWTVWDVDADGDNRFTSDDLNPPGIPRADAALRGRGAP